jgi:hypothetical protein
VFEGLTHTLVVGVDVALGFCGQFRGGRAASVRLRTDAARPMCEAQTHVYLEITMQLLKYLLRRNMEVAHSAMGIAEAARHVFAVDLGWRSVSTRFGGRK